MTWDIDCCLHSLVSAKDELLNACRSSDPSLEDLEEKIKGLKRTLIKIEGKVVEYFVEAGPHKETDPEWSRIYSMQNEAEDVLYPDDYSLDNLLYSLMEAAGDIRISNEEDHKDVVEIIIKEVEEEVRLANASSCTIGDNNLIAKEVSPDENGKTSVESHSQAVVEETGVEEDHENFPKADES